MLAWIMDQDPIILIAQIIGVFAAFFGIVSFQQRKRSGILVCQIVNNILWTVHMLMLGAIAGGLLNAIGIARGVVFYFREDRKWAQSRAWYFIFCGLFAIASLLSGLMGDGLLAILPMLGMFSTTVSLAEKDPFRVRLFSIISSPLWLSYNIVKGSIPGVCTETFLIISITVGILRLDLPRFRGKKTNETR